MAEIKDRVKEVWKDSGLTMQKFGESIGIKTSSISTIISGKTKPSDQTILFICEKYHINELWLRSGEGAKRTTRDREEDVRDAVEKLLEGENPEFKYRFVDVLSRLSDDQWWQLEVWMRHILTGEVLSDEERKQRQEKNANLEGWTDERYHEELDRQLQEQKIQADDQSASGAGSSGAV